MSDDETTAETLIIDGERKYVCNTCSSINQLVTGKTKCKTCGAWFENGHHFQDCSSLA